MRPTLSEKLTILTYTRFGAIPNVTRDLIEMGCSPHFNAKNESALKLHRLVALPHFIEYQDEVKAASDALPVGGIRGWACLNGPKECNGQLVMVTDDLGAPKPPIGFNTAKGVGSWSRSGRNTISPEYFTRLVELFRPSLAVIPADLDFPSENSSTLSGKRYDKAITRSLSFVEESVTYDNHFLNMPGGLQFGAWPAIKRDVFMRKLKQTSTVRNLALCLYLDDLCRTSDASSTDDLLCETLDHAFGDPDFKNGDKAVFGALNPFQLARAVRDHGITFCDDSYAWLLTKLQHFIRYEANGLFTVIDAATEGFDVNMEPMQIGCQCLACKDGYTVSYLYHLIATKEMQAGIILHMHNLESMHRFYGDLKRMLVATEDDNQFWTNLEASSKQCNFPTSKLFVDQEEPPCKKFSRADGFGDVGDQQ